MTDRITRNSRLIATAQSVLTNAHAKAEWRAIRGLDPRLIAAIVLVEDRHFWIHHGVDWAAVRAAAVANWRERRVRFGASTIPMQVARLLRGWTTRSYTRKLREIVMALWLIARYDREAVLEVYLNLVPFTAGTRGVFCGSICLTGHDPAQLNLFEVTLLAIALNDPEVAPGATRESARSMRIRQLRLVRQLGMNGHAGDHEVDAAEAQIEAAWRRSNGEAAGGTMR